MKQKIVILHVESCGIANWLIIKLKYVLFSLWASNSLYPKTWNQHPYTNKNLCENHITISFELTYKKSEQHVQDMLHFEWKWSLPNPLSFEKTNPRINHVSAKFCQLYLRQRKYNSHELCTCRILLRFCRFEGEGVGQLHPSSSKFHKNYQSFFMIYEMYFKRIKENFYDVKMQHVDFGNIRIGTNSVPK